ncbi:MAG: M20/M25/M40 family metallo-hydrolase [Luminiphilus sp.]|nr:M20/M25/M40 family metallo-hydrolase [Luminiphilus sp.]
MQQSHLPSANLKKNRLFPCLFMMVVCICLPAMADVKGLSETGLGHDTVREAATLRDAALQGTQAFQWVENLTTEVGPRLAGSDAEAKAREWAVNELESFGFDRVWVETFPLSGWERGLETGYVISPYPQPLTLTALGGSVATPEKGVEGDVAIFTSLQALESVAPNSLKGKIAYVGHAMRSTQDGSHYGYFGRLRREGASIAASKGAKALLIRSIGTDSHRMPHTGSMRYDPDQPKIAAAALSNPDADQLERIAARGKTPRLRLLLTPRFLGEVMSGNVIADIRGAVSPEEVVVIGGHLDSWDLGTGAIDDGAGVAITMEVARRIISLNKRPRRTIRLILWGAEEVGLLGGQAYLDSRREGLKNHVIGTESDFGAGQIWRVTSRVSDQAQPIVDLISQLVEPLGIAQGPTGVPSSGPDLTPMIAAGMPAFRFVQDGRDYFDLHHTPDDTLDKISPENLDQSVAAYLVFTWLAANTEINDWGWESAD